MSERKAGQKGIQRREFVGRVDREIRDDNQSNEIGMTARPIIAGIRYEVPDKWGRFGETVHRDAVTDLCERAAAGTLDTYVFIGHNTQTYPLAATRSKTLGFRQDPITGDLVADIKVDVRQDLAAGAAISVSRGDLGGVSIGFQIDPAGDHWNAQETERTITRFLDLPEFSLVTRPASPTTSVSVNGPSGPRGRTSAAEIRSDVNAIHARQRARLKAELRAIPSNAEIVQELLRDREQARIRYERRVAAKYSDKARANLAKIGQAMPDGSFPCRDAEDIANAVKMVGLAKPASSQPAIRKFILARARAIGSAAMALVPASWSASGDIKL